MLPRDESSARGSAAPRANDRDPGEPLVVRPRFAALVAATDDAVWLTDSAGSFIEGPSWLSKTGQSEVESAGRGWRSRIHESDIKGVLELESGTSACRICNKDGDWRWHDLRKASVSGRDEVVYVARDIHDDRIREENLRVSQQRLRIAMAASHLGVWHWKLPVGDMNWSAETKTHYGLPPDFEPVTPDLFDRLVHPQDRDRVKDAIRRSVEERDVYDVTYRSEGLDGQVRHIRALGLVFFDDDDNPSQFEGVTLDVTAQHLAEQELERRVLERTQELEGFTYSVAHDLGAPLRSVVATSRILLAEAVESLRAEHRQLLEQQARSALKLARLIDDLLRLARISRQELRRRDILVNELAEEYLSPLRQEGFDIVLGQDLRASADPTLVSLLLQNLITNAAKYSPQKGRIEVGCSVENGRKVFFVSDSGVGFEMQYAERIFRPFERLYTDGEYPGTGIGLANARRIVERHGGQIWAKAAPGEGATFFFTFE